ncbi:MAG: molybdopterin oxidoreductase, iron-sulfur binding subunit, partial [Phycisphaerales bacterium]|nr:molybdopterin oxidoreductase, iron-sulfur binding subunit [Phycisphaerales bacterium]
MATRSPISLPVFHAAPSRAESQAETPGCRDHSSPHPDEFARGAAVWDDQFSRRGFLATMGASLALAGITGGCSDRPSEPIVPYVDPPEQVVAGEPQFFATTLTRGGYGRGVIVTSREGRPIKIEGNPDHPASLGAADAQMQAAILDLYDPLRSNTVTHAGKPTTWGAFTKALATAIASHTDDDGAGITVLTDPVTSPTVAALMGELRTRWPKLRWRTHQPFGRHAVRSVLGGGGQRLEPVYDLSKADVIVAFDSDFLTDEPGSLTYARQFADGRRVNGVRPTMNRLYAAEADFSITGTKADHRLPAKPSRVGVLLQALGTQLESLSAPTPSDLSNAEAAWLSAVATDLARTRGRSLVIVGPTQSPAAQAIGLKLNQALGNLGQTVRIAASPMLSPDEQGAADWLTADINEGRARMVLILGDNPVRTSPGPALAKVLTELSNRPDGFTAHLGPYANETAFVCQWHVPQQHELEQWGDATAHDGTVSLIQPLIAPLTGGKNAIDLLEAVLGRERSAYDTVRATHAARLGEGPAFEEAWNAALRRGTLFTPPMESLPLNLMNAAEQVFVPGTSVEIAIR